MACDASERAASLPFRFPADACPERLVRDPLLVLFCTVLYSATVQPESKSKTRVGTRASFQPETCVRMQVRPTVRVQHHACTTTTIDDHSTAVSLPAFLVTRRRPVLCDVQTASTAPLFVFNCQATSTHPSTRRAQMQRHDALSSTS